MLRLFMHRRIIDRGDGDTDFNLSACAALVGWGDGGAANATVVVRLDLEAVLELLVATVLVAQFPAGQCLLGDFGGVQITVCKFGAAKVQIAMLWQLGHNKPQFVVIVVFVEAASPVAIAQNDVRFVDGDGRPFQHIDTQALAGCGGVVLRVDGNPERVQRICGDVAVGDGELKFIRKLLTSVVTVNHLIAIDVCLGEGVELVQLLPATTNVKPQRAAGGHGFQAIDDFFRRADAIGYLQQSLCQPFAVATARCRPFAFQHTFHALVGLDGEPCGSIRQARQFSP